MYATRLKAVMVVLAAGVVVLLVALFQLQVLEGARYLEEAEERLKRAPGFHPTIRGTIYDRRGVPLAQDTGAFDVAVYFPFIEMTDTFVAARAREWDCTEAEVRLRVEEMWRSLARLTGVPLEELQAEAETIRHRVEVIRQIVAERHGRRIPVREETYGSATSIAHPLVHDVDVRAAGAISSRPEVYPGLTLVQTRKREYFYGANAPHVIGRLGEVAREDLGGTINDSYPPGDLKRYWPGDLVGRSGVEAACEPILRGERGVYQKGIDGSFLEDMPPTPGGDVHLTLDVAFQADVEALLDEPPPDADIHTVLPTGAAVVLDCETGEVLVLATAPRYDVRHFLVDYPDLLDHPGRPLMNRALAGQYPLGSVFKAVTATAALHEGTLSPETTLTCEGILDRDHPNRFRCHIYERGYGHGPMQLRGAIKKSCNVFFYKAAEMMSRRPDSGRFDLSSGRDALALWAERLGLGRPTGLGLPGEAAGNLDVRDPRNLAVGQGELLVTPIQVAQLYALIATDGRMPPLKLIREWPTDRAARLGARLDPAHMDPVRDAFVAVVNEEGGSGYGRANLPDVVIAGKTGTAQSGGRREPHAWFAGFAPAERPRIAFSVILEHGGHGGAAAGPLAREIVRAAGAHGYLDDAPPEPVPLTESEPPEEPPEPKPAPVPVG